MKLTFSACSEGGMWFRLFRGWDNCSLLAFFFPKIVTSVDIP